MKKDFEESDILYLKEYPIRLNIIKYLKSKKEFVKNGEVIKNLNEGSRGNYHHHKKGLKAKGLIEVKRLNKRSEFVKITEKGSQAFEEIEKMEKLRDNPAKNEQKGERKIP